MVNQDFYSAQRYRVYICVGSLKFGLKKSAEQEISQLKNKLISTLWWTNYVTHLHFLMTRKGSVDSDLFKQHGTQHCDILIRKVSPKFDSGEVTTSQTYCNEGSHFLGLILSVSISAISAASRGRGFSPGGLLQVCRVPVQHRYSDGGRHHGGFLRGLRS